MSSAMAWWLAVMAFLNTVTAGTMLAGLCGPQVAGLAALIVAGLQAGTAAYAANRSRTTTSSIEDRLSALEGGKPDGGQTL